MGRRARGPRMESVGNAARDVRKPSRTAGQPPWRRLGGGRRRTRPHEDGSCTATGGTETARNPGSWSGSAGRWRAWRHCTAASPRPATAAPSWCRCSPGSRPAANTATGARPARRCSRPSGNPPNSACGTPSTRPSAAPTPACRCARWSSAARPDRPCCTSPTGRTTCWSSGAAGGPLRRRLRRSVPGYCARRAGCPVLTVPVPELLHDLHRLESAHRRARRHLSFGPAPELLTAKR